MHMGMRHARMHVHGARLLTARSSAHRHPRTGEAQKIDRILDTFAKHWVSSCSEAAEAAGLTPESAFILAFALIMLNTDQHNPNIKPSNKMTLAQVQACCMCVRVRTPTFSAFLMQLLHGLKEQEQACSS